MKPSSHSQQQQDRLKAARRIPTPRNAKTEARLNLTASIFFLIGSIILFCVAPKWSLNFGINNVLDDLLDQSPWLNAVLLGVGFGLLVISVVFEMIVDAKGRRQLAHARYAPATSFRIHAVNVLQNFTFLIAVILQGIAHICDVFYKTVEEGMEFNVAAANVWLVSGIFALLVRSDGCTLDIFTNFLYVTSTLLLLVGGYYMEANPNDFLGDLLQDVALLLWVVVGLEHSLRDAWQYRHWKLLEEEESFSVEEERTHYELANP